MSPGSFTSGSWLVFVVVLVLVRICDDLLDSDQSSAPWWRRNLYPRLPPAAMPKLQSLRRRGFVASPSASTKPCPGRWRRFDEAVGPAGRLPSGARSRGPAPNSLRSLSLTALRQGRRV